MNKYILAIFLFIGIFLIGVPSVHAQGQPTPTPMTCGMAGISGRDKCCPTLDVEKDIKEQFDVLGSTIVPPPIADLIGGMVSVLLKNIAGFQQVEMLQTACYYGEPTKRGDPSCKCEKPTKPVVNVTMLRLCQKYINADKQSKMFTDCVKCASGQDVNGQQGLGGYYSAIGCIPSRMDEFISNYVLRIGIGLAGMVSLGCIIYSSILLQTSKGDPEVIQKARDQITSCIIGLLMIIFSTLILRIIGVDILKIPGLG